MAQPETKTVDATRINQLGRDCLVGSCPHCGFRSGIDVHDIQDVAPIAHNCRRCHAPLSFVEKKG